LAGFIGWLFLQAVGKTSFIFKADHPSFLHYRRERKPVIYAFWHNNQVFLAYAHRNEKIRIMVSQSKDGEYIAQVMGWMGLTAIRGSSSRGGEQALREMIRSLEEGKQVGFTPDGPRGPLQTVHGGIVSAAKSTNLPIVPTAVWARRKISFNSWDKFFIPLPFNSIVVAHGQPFHVSPSQSLEEAQNIIREELNKIQSQAEKNGQLLPSYFSSILAEHLHFFYSLLSLLLTPFLIIFPFIFGFKRSFGYIKERFVIGEKIPQVSKKRIWLHAASVGEWQALLPLLKKLKTVSDLSIVITTSSPEARKIAAAQEPSIPVRLLPLDLNIFMRKWIKQIKPACAVLVETELWPSLIACLNDETVPIVVVNGRLSGKSTRHWLMIKPFIQRTLMMVSKFYVRSALDKERFLKLGAPLDRVKVTGNMKYDNLNYDSSVQKEKIKTQLVGSSPTSVLIGGSTWPGEESIFLKFLKDDKYSAWKVIIAPRKLERCDEIRQMFEKENINVTLWTDIKKNETWQTRLLLVNTLGELKNIYPAADLAFVGGSLIPHGGQNPLEPAGMGIPVTFGFSMDNFNEEKEALVKCGAAKEISSIENASLVWDELIENGQLSQMGNKGRECVRQLQGASQLNFENLTQSLGLQP
jgi:3-deoxy-D-manno-octulosonic-acid transferase